jgi:hypothetical protein
LRNPYKVLQVDPSAEPEVIEAAYRRLVRKYHPDVNQAAGAEDRMKELIDAYAVLRDPARRSAFDRQRVAPWRQWRQWVRRLRWSGPPPVPRSGRPLSGAGPWDERTPCSRHLGRPAVGACRTCGGALCSSCVSLFQPAGCAPCVWRRARRTQLRAFGTLGGFALSFGIALAIALSTIGTSVGVGVLAAYLVSSTGLGIAFAVGRMWRTGWQDEPRDPDLGVAFLVWAGLLIGWIGTPLLLVKMATDLGRGSRLVAIAGEELT